MQKKKILFILALLCAVVQGAWAQANWDAVYTMTQTTSANWTQISSGSTDGRILGASGTTTYYYINGNLSFTNNRTDNGGNGNSGLKIQGTVYLYVPEGVTVTCRGANADGRTGAGAGIELSSGNTLYLLGSGTVNATGGNAANGETGGTGGDATGGSGSWTQTGAGGSGGNGGGGAGAGIGTRGGAGGSGGSGGAGYKYNDGAQDDAEDGTSGSAGKAGSTADAMGNLYVVTSSVHLNATGGNAGTSGGSGGQRGRGYAYDGYSYNVTVAGGGGGGGGGFGGAAFPIGTGGCGGGGGGGGAQDYRSNSQGGVYDVTAPGGSGGKNADGQTSGGDGTEAGTNGTAHGNGWVTVENGSFNSGSDWNSASGACKMGSGGSGGATGSASNAGTANNVIAMDGNANYLIYTATDWNTFAEEVANSNNYSGKTVKLMDDISVSEMVGTSDDVTFQGTFDGDGHRLTFNKGTASEPFAERRCAPFRHVSDATIQNLKVDGSIYTSNDRGAGLACRTLGTTNIINCHVSTIIYSSFNGYGDHGGFVSIPDWYATLNITGCVYTGRLLTNNGTTNCGGFVGLKVLSQTKISVTNSLYAPSGIIPEGWTAINGGATFVYDDGHFTNCYYTETFGAAQGTEAIVFTAAPANLGELVQDYGMVKAYQNGIQFDGKYYVRFPLRGTGTSNNPYLITNATDWDYFASFVSSGYSFNNQYVKQIDDISVSTMAGVDYAFSFQGTFDGDGNTLTVNYNTTENNAAPFSHVRNATIKNLRVAGSITTSAPFAGGIVSESHEALTLTGCISSVAINSSKSGDGTHAGLVSVLSGQGNAILIDGCVFDGSFATTTGTIGCGGFIGWGVYNKPTIKNSLLKPGSVDANMLGSNFARWHTGDEGIYEPTFTNCYYVATANLPTDQGTQAYAVTNVPANLGNLVQNYGMVAVYQNGILFDGKYYVAPASISLADNADNSTTISNANNYVANVTLADRTLYKDGDWNTLCLPFALGDATAADGHHFDGTPLEGFTVKELDTETAYEGHVTGLDGSTLYLNFKDATSITAGVPYIVRKDKADGYDDADPETRDLKNPVFTGVTISTGLNDVALTGGAFKGTYSPKTLPAGNASNLYLGAGNTLYWPAETGTGRTINAFRAYFHLTNGVQARAFSLHFGDENDATGIRSMDNGQWIMDNCWYDLSGRKLSKKPTQKGVYIYNGNKRVIK